MEGSESNLTRPIFLGVSSGLMVGGIYGWMMLVGNDDYLTTIFQDDVDQARFIDMIRYKALMVGFAVSGAVTLISSYLMNREKDESDSVSSAHLRKVIKEVTMTHFYNSEAWPRKLLSSEELKVFYEVITGLLPGAEAVMYSINQCWNNQADHHSWIMPDGHTAYVPVVEGISGTYMDSELGEIPLKWYQKTNSQNYRSLCPNVIHSIDGYVAREMVRRCDFQLSHVHDCFVFNPNYLQKVSKTYREIMAELAKSDLFNSILRQLTGNSNLVVTKISNDLDIDILNSEYMLS